MCNIVKTWIAIFRGARSKNGRPLNIDGVSVKCTICTGKVSSEAAGWEPVLYSVQRRSPE